MQTAGSGSIVERVMGIVKLDVPTYEEVERDTNATTQAAIVVAVVAIASGIGALGADDDTNAAVRFIVGLILAFVAWLVLSAVAYFVGTKVLPGKNTSATIGELMRTLGFAQAPNVLAVFGIIGTAGALIAFVAAIWGIVCAVVALRQALEMSTGRAIAVGLISAIVAGIVVAIIGIPFGLGLGAT